MNILGINYIFHDSSACLVVDDKLVFAIEEERLTREKHTDSFPVNAIAACCQHSNIRAREIDHIAVSVDPGRWQAEKLMHAASLDGTPAWFLDYEFARLEKRHLTFWRWYRANWPSNGSLRPKVHFIDHHTAHAVGSYYVSPWDHAALLSIDGWGEWSTAWLGAAVDSDIEQYGESLFPHSLGVIYSAVTEFCGFKANYDEGKTMGLAPTGNPARFKDVVDRLVDVDDNGQITVDTTWFDFPSLTGRLCGDRLIAALGPVRRSTDSIEEHHRDAAAAFQAKLEECILKMTALLARRSRHENLVFAGGVALNSVANGRIIREGHFRDIYVMPGAGDNGTAIGAAAYVHSHILGRRPRLQHADPYLGNEYDNDAIETVLRGAKAPYRLSPDICSQTANLLHQRKIVGWFQGRMEFGPRALGARSILADPTYPGMKDKINAEVKHREAFRPFGPSVTVERAKNYFETSIAAPFMLSVCPVKIEMREKIPAIVHVDGTARLQTVEHSVNPKYHRLLTKFEALSGHPVVLNTSLNVMNEPIINTPEDALRCFYSTGLDALAIGDFILEKS
jgi:carbamoyltransferase